ncbi:unnamed protein product [Caenorhabditis bovis]|uniref:Uncharacterized protein n=1 Tax=Caenorhabditis bovis TaxID=2654633 RepID=A0A8S1FC65_9PELO|nr:unnamed protein product [Caenorhabditis bovis]
MGNKGKLYFYIYRGNETSADDLTRSIVEKLKEFVFASTGILLSCQGYSGIPLRGEFALDLAENETYKIINILFSLSNELDDLVFRIETETPNANPFYVECLKNEVVPKWVTDAKKFVENIFGYGGVLHVITPEIEKKWPNLPKIDVIRKESQKTRNILVTESIKQKLDAAASRSFGMQRTSVNVPAELAYIVKERPDLLSAAIREFKTIPERHGKELEQKLNETDCVMVHVLLNETDWKIVTAFADIESPTDIVSHRISLAMLAFDEKYSSIPNGLDHPTDATFQKVGDRFERERLQSIQLALFGQPHSLSHMYQCAKTMTTSKHHAECRKVFVDESSSADQQSVYSGDDDEASYKANYARRQVFKKRKKGDLGKKRQLAAVITKSNAPEVQHAHEMELATPTSSAQLKNFERAVNGDDVYYKESECDSLGEDEELDMFVGKTKLKKATLNANKKDDNEKFAEIDRKLESEDDGFDVADLLRAAPPLAKYDEFDEFDSI